MQITWQFHSNMTDLKPNGVYWADISHKLSNIILLSTGDITL